MKKEISVGLLLPSSTILPMGKDFEKGFKQGIAQISDAVTIEKEFTGNGSQEKTKQAIDKLISYDDVDVITGVVNNRALEELIPKFENKRSVFFPNNIGESLPSSSVDNEQVFLNSRCLWSQVHAVSKWAVEHIGNKGMYVSGLYDSGYSFCAAMDLGMQASGLENTWGLAIAPVENPQSGGLADVSRIIPAIQEHKPNFVFATFCGEEAKIFLEAFVNAGLHKEITLIGVPYLLENYTHNSEIPLDIYIPKVLQSDETLKSVLNWRMDYFNLGYETGQILVKSFEKDGVLKKNLEDTVPQAATVVSLLKVTLESGELQEAKVALVSDLGLVDKTDKEIQKLIAESSAGWFNPYLSI